MASQRDRGLYDPRNEHDACGVGFVANFKGRKSHDIIPRGLQILVNLDHRGAVGADPLMGDGAGCMIQTPDALLRHWAGERGIELPPPGRYAVAMCFLPMDETARAVVYKGLLLAPQVQSFYDDLRNPLTVSALALVHQRFSTNTFPSWRLAHPYRFICHNGEITTVRGKVNLMAAS